MEHPNNRFCTSCFFRALNSCCLEFLSNLNHLFFFKFFKGIVIKSLGRKKEGNRLLRSIDSDGIDANQLSHNMNNFGNTLFNNGQDSLARLIFQEASKLHIFKSKYQRPVIALPREMETKPVWTVEQAQLSSFFR